MVYINFTKMNGLGNDFIILEYEEYLKTNMPANELAKKVCDRHFSIGADGLIIINPNTDNADISWIFYNSDGSVAQMCGNGMRCFAKYVYDKKIITKNIFSVETLAGIIKPEILPDGNIKVQMTIPILETSKIPFLGDKILNYKLELNKDSSFVINTVSMGNPHCIIFTDEDINQYAVKYGTSIENHSLFPEKTNVEFIKVLSRNEINFSVWERGCGITLACGTGACAAVVAAILNNLCDNKVKVNLPGGSLYIEWQGSIDNQNHHVYMSGSADYSFIGKINI